ncbi:hypothetical protein [Adlercreutzia sp. ZJ141]|uniref:hypothetical protein n=1 Tax=Adlercreutzia sp. ZJ141 TaxID=2709406 RepID=UPI0013EB0867|nr:hypothetical protein [Adlercreutzia sp. ZJ141]
MKKPYIYQAASGQVANSQKKNLTPWLPVLCMLAALGVVLTATLLGSSLGRFSAPDACAIPLVPDATETDVAAVSDASVSATSVATEQDSTTAQSTSQPAAKSANSASTDSAETNDGSAASARSTVEGYAASNPSAAAQPGSMQVYGTPQVWSTETQVDLFRSSYNNTVASADGDKLIAPGTTNRYDFTLRNNAEVPLGYEVSLKVEAWSAGAAGGATTSAGDTNTSSTNDPAITSDADASGAVSASKTDAMAATASTEDTSSSVGVPLEWRLLTAAGDSVSDWQPHGENVSVLDTATLDAGRQAGYAIEWRWAYEQGDASATDATTATDQTAAGTASARATANTTDTDTAAATDLATADATDTAHGDHAALEDFGVKATIFVRAEQAPPSPAAETPKTPQDIVAGLLAQTGDSALALVAACLLAVAACALIVVVIARRKREKDADHARG